MIYINVFDINIYVDILYYTISIINTNINVINIYNINILRFIFDGGEFF